MRGQKGTLWEGGHRVPAVAYCPSRIPAKGVTAQTTITFDLLPTFAHLAQAPIPDDWQLDGLNLWPLMGRNEPLAERSLFWRFNDRSCIRRDGWKLMSGEDGGLFNLAQDLSESVDLASSNPQLARELQAELDQWNQTVSDGVARQS